MIKSMRNKLLAVLCVAVMTLGVVAPSFMNTAFAAAQRTVYVDVEKNVLGGKILHQPKKITLDENDTILDATKQAVGDSNVDNKGNYIQAFRDNETVNEYPKAYTEKLKEVSDGVIYRKDLPNQQILNDPEWLREKEYTGISGWMFTVDNTMSDSKYNYYTAGTKLADLTEGAVIRWEFTEAMGADLGLVGSAWIPTAVTAEGYYDWGKTVQLDPFFTRADKSELIRSMANHDNKKDKAYKNALKALNKLEISQDDVNTVIGNLK